MVSSCSECPNRIGTHLMFCTVYKLKLTDIYKKECDGREVS